MADNNKLPKDVAEQIQGLASDVYIQIEDKLTHLIASAVKAEVGNNAAQQTKDLSEQEVSHTKALEQLKHELAEKNADQAALKQSFQVELTQNTINYTETIERLEKELKNANQKSSKVESSKQSNTIKLEEKLLEIEQKLTNKTQETDGLNGRIMVLTEQEQSLTNQIASANAKMQEMDKLQLEAIAAAKVEAQADIQVKVDALTEQLKKSDEEKARMLADSQQEASKQIEELTKQLKQADEDKVKIKAEAQQEASKQVEVLTAQLKQADEDKVKIQTEAQQAANAKVADIEKNISQYQEQIIQEQNGKAEIQQQLSAMQKSIDTEQDKTKAAEQRCNDYQNKIIKITEQSDEEKQKHLDEIKAINDAGEEAKTLQTSAQQKIIELDKVVQDLNSQIEADKKSADLHQQEVTALNEQLKTAQDNHESLLTRFNNNRDKQEIENNKVRETIKFLRDENHQLITESTEQKTEYTEQLNQLEHKLTEYRLKFEYAQKQLAKV